VRRARDRVVQLHRREVAEHVRAARGRGIASVAARRSASKAELFEAGLGRVSSSLARAARAAAASLRAERLEAARSVSRGVAAEEPTQTPRRPKSPTPRARDRTAIERKAAAATRASTARRQARRDAGGAQGGGASP
jgi:hypothetical protein